jgi:hypothetical protein
MAFQNSNPLRRDKGKHEEGLGDSNVVVVVVFWVDTTLQSKQEDNLVQSTHLPFHRTTYTPYKQTLDGSYYLRLKDNRLR